MPEELLEIPRIISVDDHVMEPPDLWTSRLAARYRDRAPRIERAKATVTWRDGFFRFERSEDGTDCDWWVYEDYEFAIPAVMHGAGVKDVDNAPTTFDAMDPSVWDQSARIAAMRSDHVDAALCFPNTMPRFAGQAFAQRSDKDLALACVRAYNDWLIDDWGGGEGKGVLLPVAITPFWDPELAAAEIERVAAKGCCAITFPENPHPLGFPSLYALEWDPLFRAAADTEMVVCLHIGSSSKLQTTSPEAPFIISSTLTFGNVMGSVMDFVFSGILERIPDLRLAFSEGQVGWLPYLLERADKLWAERGSNSFGSTLPAPPSSYLKDRAWFCIFDDETGLRNRDVIGMNQICYEVDFPHADSPYPNTLETVRKIVGRAGLDNEEVYKLLRGNAIEAFELGRFGIDR